MGGWVPQKRGRACIVHLWHWVLGVRTRIGYWVLRVRTRACTVHLWHWVWVGSPALACMPRHTAGTWTGLPSLPAWLPLVCAWVMPWAHPSRRQQQRPSCCAYCKQRHPLASATLAHLHHAFAIAPTQPPQRPWSP